MPANVRSKAPLWVRLLIQVLILYSVVTTTMETMPRFAEYGAFFLVSETVVVILFTIEYFAFWVLSDNRLRYPFRFMAIVDLLAILPFYLQLGIDMRNLRALRLLRIFRVLKLGRYSRALQTLGEALRRTAPELAIALFGVSLVAVICSMAVYYAEHRIQPTAYASIPDSMWWTAELLVKAGNGDVYPVTTIGRLVAIVIRLAGIALIAVPAGLLGSTMVQVLRERRNGSVAVEGGQK